MWHGRRLPCWTCTWALWAREGEQSEPVGPASACLAMMMRTAGPACRAGHALFDSTWMGETVWHAVCATHMHVNVCQRLCTCFLGRLWGACFLGHLCRWQCAVSECVPSRQFWARELPIFYS